MGDVTKPKWMHGLPSAATDEQAFNHWLIQQSKMNLRGPVGMAEAAWFAALDWRATYGVDQLSSASDGAVTGEKR